MIYSKPKDYRRPPRRKRYSYNVGDLVLIGQVFPSPEQRVVLLEITGITSGGYYVHNENFYIFHITKSQIIGKIEATNKLYRLIHV